MPLGKGMPIRKSPSITRHSTNMKNMFNTLMLALNICNDQQKNGTEMGAAQEQ
jgi:hypothetical protein